MDIITYLQATGVSTVAMLLLSFFSAPCWLPSGYDFDAMELKYDGVPLIVVVMQINLAMVAIISPFTIASSSPLVSTSSLFTATAITLCMAYFVRKQYITDVMEEAQVVIEAKKLEDMKIKRDNQWSKVERALISISERIADTECRTKSQKLIELLPRMKDCEKKFTSTKWKVLFSSIERLCSMDERWNGAYTFGPDENLKDTYLETLEITTDRIIEAVEAAERSAGEQDHASLKAIQVQQSIHA